jgi:AraC-like DNA-binding protein
MPAPHYRVLFLQPSPALSSHVVGYVVRRLREPGPANRGTDDSVSFPANVYSALSIVHSGRLRDPRSGRFATMASFSGAMTRPVHRQLIDAPEITTVLMRPGAAAQLSRVPGRELTDTWADARDILSPAEYLEITERVAEQPTIARQIMVIERMLLRRIERFALGSLPTLSSLLGSATSALARLKVTDLARRASLSERQLNRRMLDALGIGPKLLLRLARVQESVRIVRELRDQRQPRPLDALAQDAGFADASHMTRELRLFTSRPPLLLRERLSEANLNEWAYELPADW